MKRIVLMALLFLALPLTVFANSSVDFTNSGGTLSGSGAGLMLSGSNLIAVNGLNGMGLLTGSNLGSLTFSTGALMSGSLAGGGMFSGTGSSFVITGNGSSGVPSGVIFQGMFSGPVTWTMMTLANGTHIYSLSGTITGTWMNGTTVSGASVQLTLNTGKGFFTGSVNISSGDSSIVTTVPEPGTLGLLGTGLVGLAGAVRRKLRA